MESDIAEMGRTGRIVAPVSPEAPPMPVPAPPTDGNSSFWVWAVVAASGVAVLFLIGYFLLPMFFPRQTSPPPSSSARPPALPAASPAADFFAHRSYFQSPADATVTAYVTKDDLWTEVRRSLAEASSSASVIEVDLEDNDGRPLSLVQFLEMAGIGGSSLESFGSKFQTDLTFFIYRDSRGVWPGFAAKLKSGQSPFSLQSLTLALEGDVAVLSAMFLDPPGSFQGGFEDIQVSGRPARSLLFASPGAALTYGWFRNEFLILSTAQEGFRQALLRL